MVRTNFIRLAAFGLAWFCLTLPPVGGSAWATEADDVVQAILALKASAPERADSALQGEMGALQTRLAALGGGGMTVTEGGVQQPPPNDLCTDAILITCSMPSIDGTTTGAGIDSGYVFCGTGITSPGVWYTIIGNGGWIRVDTCTNTAWDTKISVYTTSCDPATATCVGGNDDTCGLQSEVQFTSTAGQQYWVLVHGFGGASGPFTLTITCEIPVELQSFTAE